MFTRKIGGELEYPIVYRDGRAISRIDGIDLVTHNVSSRGELRFGSAPGEIDGVVLPTDWGPIYHTFDATWCTTEGNLPVVSTLHEMQAAVEYYLQELLAGCRAQDAYVFGGGMTPVTSPTTENYQQLVRNRAVYRAITDVSWRGEDNFPYHYNWNHAATAFTAHHSPWIDVKPEEAADALAVAHGLTPLFYLLFASAPLCGGKLTSVRDVRPRAWQSFMSTARIKAQRSHIGMLHERPRRIRGILKPLWEDQPMWFLPLTNGSSYKGGTVAVVAGEPSLLEFLSNDSLWLAVDVEGNSHRIKPSEALIAKATDWWQFGSRWRFTLYPERFDLSVLVGAYNFDSLETYFYQTQALQLSAIEFRDFSAQPLPDVMASFALSLGLIENLEAAVALLDQYGWFMWRCLMEDVLHHGFDARVADATGKQVSVLAEQMLQIAYVGLEGRDLGEEKYLAPLWSRLEKRQAPADQMTELFHQGGIEAVLAEFSFNSI